MADDQEEMMQDFLRGFAKATGMNSHDADVQWAAHSRGLSDDELAEIQAGGYDAGITEGQGFLEMYPPEEER